MSIPQGRVRRTAPLAALSARAAGGSVIEILRRRLTGQKGTSLEFHVRNAERYADTLSRSKGVLMKVGQIVSFVDVSAALDKTYGEAYRAALSSLQSDAEPMAPELVAAVIESELGKPPEELFADFDTTPIAAASIGQVHRATLHDGTEVAVKVQYPGVADAIGDDLANTQLLFTFIKIAAGMLPQFRHFDVRAIADEITERFREELDYTRELEHQQAFADHYRGHPYVRIPEVFPELSAARVLTMEMVHGRRWDDTASADQTLKDRWGEIAYRFFFSSIARLGMFNADPHPGNYLFHDDGTVTFLDFGCVKRLPPSTQQGVWDTAAAAIAQDGEWLQRIYVEHGFTPADDPVDPDALLAWFGCNFGHLLAPQPFTITPAWVAEVLASMANMDKEMQRRSNVPKDFLFTNRIFVGLYSILAALQTTADWRAIFEEDTTGEPRTELGRLDIDFFAAKGRA